ncbi:MULTISPECIES: extracellular catalytic domain type 1 short-chain-length polyhydroxyalkanoate depolymerase [Bradyrhizobium]|uniref:extracellular catalytic domain type 1 short-chain-length polyhydroxyalkanoate depolymerase n=1 Tax=Bradyrhizobium TaxID=374 RepID=UPI000412A82E|nr:MULTISPECIES: PHB depolymerase family esterase [Bradyrhizobium]WLB89053.1 PHB depolymerase family esterase [Bradyrhizobium japonicum USDA 135]GLR95647.1 esterase [Bradyrhizobium liaoningense]
MSLAKNIDLLRRLPRLDGLRFGELGRSADSSSPLEEVLGFGDNPGALRMFTFVPAQLQKPRALVVVLHGCGQTAAGYDLGAGWSTLARHYGFALLMPEQQRVNNGNTCFNWFNPEDTVRGGGEAHSIREMIAHMVETHRIDSRRVFITGLSAGGGMTTVMLATYPEVFAAGAVIAGLPYGIASNLREALEGMFHSPARPARELGDLVRSASDHRGPWPKVSVWHGSADRTVNPGNANEIVKQWLDLHDLPDAPMAETVVDGYPRQAWWNKDGETLVESYAITDMAHGTPLGIADNDQRYGVEGAFLIEAGISSSYHIAKFFGLTGWIPDAATRKAEAKPAMNSAPKPALSPAPHLARSIRAAIAEEQAEPQREKARGFDLGQIITRALTAAGLMK